MNRRIVIAVDSFKGSATSMEAAGYIEKGLFRGNPALAVRKVAIADGGEGTVEALVTGLSGRRIKKQVTGPEGAPVSAVFGLLDDETAIIEMAEASGLTKIKNETGNPFMATTYGTGELIKFALDEKVKTIYIGLGGSATNDGGVGMAQALGISFKDAAGQEVGFGASGVLNIHTIDRKNIDPRIAETTFIGLTDVENLLCGKQGASYIFGSQKGAKEDELALLDQSLHHLQDKISEYCGQSVSHLKGGGAAGGLGAGLAAFCQAKLVPGIETISCLLHLEEEIKAADFVITGEGRIDHQSLSGKAPVGILRTAQKHRKPVIAIVGSVAGSLHDIYEAGFDLVIDTISAPITLQEAMTNVRKNLQNGGETVAKVLELIEKQN
ncbi:glycerate kinase [Enterococcus sp. BWT-B8]|uniref:glycerate kinase n=1 Tax=unclassified Enterococcus TaxID=2608891 RepID=UPI001E4BEF1E|nr:MULTISPECIES: glycerate kinase [unclassified Enterococcus]MCB5952458.1 glycerate kinase [Enterococcus sp. BWT-B8]MCB5953510.1 glycerate kinase [Enterococcus sp. CWB-B31]